MAAESSASWAVVASSLDARQHLAEIPPDALTKADVVAYLKVLASESEQNSRVPGIKDLALARWISESLALEGAQGNGNAADVVAFFEAEARGRRRAAEMFRGRLPEAVGRYPGFRDQLGAFVEGFDKLAAVEEKAASLYRI